MALALGLLVTEAALTPFEPAVLSAGWTGAGAQTPDPGAERSAPLSAVELVGADGAGVVDGSGTARSPVAPGPAGVGIGIYTPAPLDGALEPIRGFEALVDHRMAYALWFQAWGDADAAFRPDLVGAVARRGLVPVITWEPWRRDFAAPTTPQPRYSLSSIADGEHDAYLRDWARQARAAGTPIVLRFAHEATTRPGEKLWYPWQGEPEEYRRAFRRVVGLFRAEGADNVRFMFSGMRLHEHADAYYPGDDVVDYVGSTVLNHGTAPDVPSARWRSFAELFAPQYRAARAWGKPVFLTEVASAEQGGDKARWLGDFLDALPRDYPSVVGILLLETRDREWSTIDWSVASGPESLAAFRRAVADPHFR